MSISVAMAVCNGEKYIEQQLNSIIHNLNKDDEIVISYNESEDATLEMIEEAAHQLPIIKVYSCEDISFWQIRTMYGRMTRYRKSWNVLKKNMPFLSCTTPSIRMMI